MVDAEGARPAAEPRRYPPIFMSWSGAEGDAMARAFGHLVARIFGEQLTWQSSTDLTGSDWRKAIQTAVAGAGVVVIAATPESIASWWLHYEAGAFFARFESTYLLSRGVTPADLTRSPLAALQLYNALDRDTVRRLILSVVDAAGISTPATFDAAFEAGWPTFQRDIKTAATAGDARLAARTRRRWRQMAGFFMAGMAAVGLMWSAATLMPKTLSVGLRCGAVSVFGLNPDCEWERWLASQAAAGGAAAGERLLNRISRRPFAVLSRREGPPLIAWAGRNVEGAIVRLVHAPSNSENGDFTTPGIVYEWDGNIRVAYEKHQPLHNDFTLIRVDTLSDDRICNKLDFLKADFGGDTKAMAAEIAGFVSTFGLSTTKLQSSLPGWIQACR